MGSASSYRRVRVERGSYVQPNRKYAVCCRHSGRPLSHRRVGDWRRATPTGGAGCGRSAWRRTGLAAAALPRRPHCAALAPGQVRRVVGRHAVREGLDAGQPIVGLASSGRGAGARHIVEPVSWELEPAIGGLVPRGFRPGGDRGGASLDARRGIRSTTRDTHSKSVHMPRSRRVHGVAAAIGRA
jgi:hypothetical protein